MIIRILSTVILLWGCQGEPGNQATVKTSPAASDAVSEKELPAEAIIPLEEADVVADGVINELDVQAVTRFAGAADKFPTTPIFIKNPDVNKDGAINLYDVAAVDRHKGKKVPVAVEPITTWEQADLNDDEAINILDMTLAAGQAGDVAAWIKIGSIETIKADGESEGKYMTVDEADVNNDGIINHVDGWARIANLANVQNWFGKDKDGQIVGTAEENVNGQ